VRKGLEGREAVASIITTMQSMVVIIDVTEPPQSPVFCGTPQKMRPKEQE
jgi:hypothetical protein